MRHRQPAPHGTGGGRPDAPRTIEFHALSFARTGAGHPAIARTRRGRTDRPRQNATFDPRSPDVPCQTPGASEGHNGNGTNRPRLLIADHHELLLDLIRMTVEPEFEVVACVAEEAALVQAALDHQPDIALLDADMPLLHGVGPRDRLLPRVEDIRVVCMDIDPSHDNAARAFHEGAVGYIAKSRPAAELLEALRVVARGDMFLTPVIADGNVEAMRALSANMERPPLSRREEQVLQLVVDGLTMKEIARRLDISPRTVAFHKYRGMHALGAQRNSDLVAIAMRPDSFWKRRH